MSHPRTPIGELAGKFPHSKNKKGDKTMKRIAKLLTLIPLLLLISCSNPTDTSIPEKKLDFDDTPATLLNESLKAFEEIHEWILAGKPFGKQNALLKVNADSVWIYGDTLTGGIGVIVTEKHSYPKGLLLITKNYKYGDYQNLKIISITERFISWTQYNNNQPETKTKTEITFESAPSKTIITHITKWTRNIQTRETYQFKEPVITIDNSKNLKTVRKADPNNEVIVTEVYNTLTNELIYSRWTGPSSTYNGGFFTRTNNYENGNIISWTKTTTVGQPDRSILRYIERYP